MIGPAYENDGWYALPGDNPWLAGHFADSESEVRRFVDERIDASRGADRWAPEHSTLTMTAEQLAKASPALREQYGREFERATGRTMMRANPTHVEAVRRFTLNAA